MSQLERVYIVAGEMSGDLLGASLMQALKARYPQIEFRGIGGPGMIAAGIDSRFPLETLSVMGLVEVVKHLPQLLRVRRALREDALAWKPDVMIGIDAPDFNLGLERQLREAGLTTMHYVSPSVWAWRQGRVKGIARAVDAMLALLPFEAAFYEQHGLPVAFVGHPLADELPLVTDREGARAELNISLSAPVLAVLPGSRANEIRFLGATFLDAAERLCRKRPALQILMPAANPLRRVQLEELLAQRPGLEGRVTLLDGQARQAMVASDVVLLASGTAALEAMLCHRSMLVAYRMAPLTHWLARRLVKTQWISLPNLIAQETLVPELIQDAVTPETLAEQLGSMLDDGEARAALEQRFATLHAELQRNASARAVEAIEAVVAGLPLPASVTSTAKQTLDHSESRQ